MADDIQANERAYLQAWQNQLNRAKPLTKFAQISAINQFFNAIPFQSDAQNWGRQDYWASPTELLAKQAGDCEDYAVAKYLSLIKLGIDPQQLKLAYVRVSLNSRSSSQQMNVPTAAGENNGGIQSHMVLLYVEHENASPWVLDNLKQEVLRVNQRADLLPVYAFNDEGMWLFNGWHNTKQLSLAMRPAHWLDLKKRMLNKSMR